MSNPNQAPSSCHFCCGPCKIWRDVFDGASLHPYWQGDWVLDSSNLYASSTTEKQGSFEYTLTDGLPNDGRMMSFDIKCETVDGAVSFIIGDSSGPLPIFELHFGANSGIYWGWESDNVDRTGRFTETLAINTWYRVRIEIHQQANDFEEIQLYLDGTLVQAFVNTEAGPVTEYLQFTNRRKLITGNAQIVDNLVYPANPAVNSDIRIRNFCFNLIDDTGESKYSKCTSVDDLDIATLDFSTMDLEVSSAGEPANDLTHTLTFDSIDGRWETSYALGVHTFSRPIPSPFSGTLVYHLRNVYAHFHANYFEVELRFQEVGFYANKFVSARWRYYDIATDGSYTFPVSFSHPDCDWIEWEGFFDESGSGPGQYPLYTDVFASLIQFDWS